VSSSSASSTESIRHPIAKESRDLGLMTTNPERARWGESERPLHSQRSALSLGILETHEPMDAVTIHDVVVGGAPRTNLELLTNSSPLS
jgi:hypothetical protein